MQESTIDHHAMKNISGCIQQATQHNANLIIAACGSSPHILEVGTRDTIWAYCCLEMGFIVCTRHAISQ